MARKSAEDPQTVQTGTPEPVAQRRARLQQIQASRGDEAQGKEETNIPDWQMANLPRPATLHGLELILVALPSGAETVELQNALNRWPIEIIAGALTPPPAAGGGGVDWEKHSGQIAQIMGVDTDALPAHYGRLWFSISGMHPEFAETVYPMASKTPDVSSVEDLAALFAAHFTSPMHYIDLLRTLWAVCGGFPGDMASRFAQPLLEQATPAAGDQ